MVVSSRQRSKKQPAYLSLRKKLNSFLKGRPLRGLLTDPNLSWITASLLIVLEFFVVQFVINKIPYTEIDWRAYMQEVEGVLNGTLNYAELKGDTGPLVYPAGFVYIFLILYGITNHGTNIYIAQYIFAVMYLLTLFLVFKLYIKTKVPPYALIFMCCTSYRIHSIYVLRLFNDPVAIFIFLLALNMFVSNRWNSGCILFSVAVSVKMNILLFAPGLLYLLLSTMSLYDVARKLTLCALVQVVLGLPFLATHPVNYLSGAFNMGRVFLYQWTVNWRLLPEEVFLNRHFHIMLLVFHAITLCLFYYKWNKYFHSSSLWPKLLKAPPSVDYILLVMFVSNFVGMVFCRSLHYQFYVWYFFTLPYLLWCTRYSSLIKLSILGILELSWNCYPSTFLSSAAMHCCHLLILGGILWSSETPTSRKVVKTK